MAEALDTTNQEQKRKRYLRWGLALSGMACWTILIGTAGYCLWTFVIVSAGRLRDVTGDWKLAQSYIDKGEAVLYGALALALAPWIAGGIVLGRRWWRSRRSEAPQPTN